MHISEAINYNISFREILKFILIKGSFLTANYF